MASGGGGILRGAGSSPTAASSSSAKPLVFSLSGGVLRAHREWSASNVISVIDAISLAAVHLSRETPGGPPKQPVEFYNMSADRKHEFLTNAAFYSAPSESTVDPAVDAALLFSFEKLYQRLTSDKAIEIPLASQPLVREMLSFHSDRWFEMISNMRYMTKDNLAAKIVAIGSGVMHPQLVTKVAFVLDLLGFPKEALLAHMGSEASQESVIKQLEAYICTLPEFAGDVHISFNRSITDLYHRILLNMKEEGSKIRDELKDIRAKMTGSREKAVINAVTFLLTPPTPSHHRELMLSSVLPDLLLHSKEFNKDFSSELEKQVLYCSADLVQVMSGIRYSLNTIRTVRDHDVQYGGGWLSVMINDWHGIEWRHMTDETKCFATSVKIRGAIATLRPEDKELKAACDLVLTFVKLLSGEQCGTPFMDFVDSSGTLTRSEHYLQLLLSIRDDPGVLTKSNGEPYVGPVVRAYQQVEKELAMIPWRQPFQPRPASNRDKNDAQ